MILPIRFICRPGRWGWLAVALVLVKAFFSPAIAAQEPRPPIGQQAAKPLPPETITIRGVVLDDSLNVPVAGAVLYIADTKYGAVANTQGEFSLTFPIGWKPVRGGVLELHIWSDVFLFKHKIMRLDWRSPAATQPLVVRLASATGRGRVNGTSIMMRALPVPPPTYPARLRTSRS